MTAYLTLALACLIALPAASAVTVSAPSFTLNGSFTIQVEGANLNGARLSLDSGQGAILVAQNQSRLTLSVGGVPDGERTYRLNVTLANGTREFVGRFAAQDLIALVAKEVEQAVAAAQGAEAAAARASSVASDLLSKFADVVQRDDVSVLTNEVLAIKQNQGKLVAAVKWQELAANGAQDEVSNLKHSATFLVLVLFLGVGLLAFFYLRVRQEVRLNPEDRAMLRALAARFEVTPQDPAFLAALRSLGYDAPTTLGDSRREAHA